MAHRHRFTFEAGDDYATWKRCSCGGITERTPRETPLTDATRPAPRDPWSYKDNKALYHAVIGIVIVVIVVAAIGRSLSSHSGGGNSASDRYAQESTAGDVCKEAIRSLLESPKSAVFSHLTVTRVDGTFELRGDVDADNLYGASLRQGWHCTAEVDGPNVRATRYNLDGP